MGRGGQPAKEYVARTRFRPATVGGRPVEAWIRSVVFFQDPVGVARYKMDFDEPPVLLNARELPGLVRTHYPSPCGTLAWRAPSRCAWTCRPPASQPRLSVQLMTAPALDEPAVAVVRMLRFRPARLHGSAVKGWVTMPLHFGRVPAAR